MFQKNLFYLFVYGQKKCPVCNVEQNANISCFIARYFDYLQPKIFKSVDFLKTIQIKTVRSKSIQIILVLVENANFAVMLLHRRDF